MTGRLSLGGVVICVLLITGPSIALAKSYTLNEAMNEALRRSEQLQIQRNEILTTRERIDDSVRNFFPDVSVTVREDGSLPDNLDSAYEANMTQPLWTGGRLTGTYRQNRADLRSKRMEYQMVARDIIERVINAHFSLLRFRSAIEARRKALAQARETYEIVQEQRRSGDATELDMLTVQDRLNELRVGLQQAENNLKQARLDYNRLLKRDLTDTLTAQTGRFTLSNDTPPEITQQRIEQTSDELLRNSFRLRHLRAEVDYSEYGLRLAESSYFPELNFESEYNASGSETFENNEYEYFLGLNFKMFFLGHSIQSNARDRRLETNDNFEEKEVTVSFFDNNPSSVQTDIDNRSAADNDDSLKVQNRTAQSRLDSARLRLENARDEELNRLRSLFYQLETDRLNIVKNRTNLRFQNKKLDVMQRRRDLGQANPLDLLQTTTDRFNAHRSLIESWYSYYNNKLKIDLASGRIEVQILSGEDGEISS